MSFQIIPGENPNEITKRLKPLKPADRLAVCTALLAMPKYAENKYFMGMAGNACMNLRNYAGARGWFNQIRELNP